VSLRTPADLRDLYGFIVEPAYRRGLTLLVSSDREIYDLNPAEFVDPVGYAWTLERLQHIGARFSLGPAPDGMPPLTPIESLLYYAMRDQGLAPIAQYGIGKYRADFAFPGVRLVVECDGRPWHDPDRDRQRDAILRRMGWEPIHFSGSEIVRDPKSCATAVANEANRRRAIAESEQPEILIPARLSWWARLVNWIKAGRIFRRRDAQPTEAPAADVAPAAQQLKAWSRNLDPEQRAAVSSHDGVVQVIAPAGSGKTTVLVSRVQELVARGVPPNRILCCTFNKAAAGELQSRIVQAGIDGVEATTFHAIGRKILKEADLLRGDVLTLTQGQWRRLAKLAMDATEEGVWIEAPAAKEQISDLKLGLMVTVEEYSRSAIGPAELTVAELYRLYEADLEERGGVDFDDFIFRSVRLLQDDAAARRHWQGEFTAVLVDEYQDIEPAQELLVQMLAAPEDLLLCVGDEDQCLYAWRRASVERVIELDQLYPGLERHALARNYRCPVTVVDASRALISHNQRRFPKDILAAQSLPGTVTLVAASDLAAQGAFVARTIKGLDQGQAVVLARTTRVLSEIALSLAQAGVRFFGPEKIKRRSGEAAVLLSYLRVLSTPGRARPEDVNSIFRVPNRYLPDEAEVSVASALRSGLTFSAALARIQVGEQWRRSKLTEAGALFDRLALTTDAAMLVHLLRTDGGLDRHYGESEQLNPIDKSAVDSLAQWERAAAGMGAAEYAVALDYEAHIIEQHFDPTAVELATVHGAKGRQWPLVIVAGFEEGEFPHARSLSNTDDPDGELEGERRLAYVALTRASDTLILMHSAQKPSLFIAEAAIVIPSAAPEQPLARAASSSHAAGALQVPPIGSAGPRPVCELQLPQQQVTPPPRRAGADAMGQRAPDGSIPCSLPMCHGTVSGSSVREMSGIYAGLCPDYEGHVGLVSANPRYDELFAKLTALGQYGPRASSHRPSGPRALTGGAIRCSLPECGGIVKPEYTFELDGSKVGLCGQRDRHQGLASARAEIAETLRRLEAANRAAWLSHRR